MQGILISVDLNAKQAVIACDDKLYTAKLSANEASLQKGDHVEFSAIEKADGVKDQTVKIDAVIKDAYKQYGIAISAKSSVSDHAIIDTKHNVKLCGEGSDANSALGALIELAKKSNANALLNTKLTVKSLRFSGKLLFCYKAEAAIIEGPKYHQKPGVKLDINERVVRRNSPNEAMIRYIRVLLISILFIILPCLLSLQQQRILPPPFGSIACGVTLGLSLFAGLFYSSRKQVAYLLRQKH
ncbi:hypothetical protein [uncultured Succinatimonas sp.]|uniref:hypothetical protein n=1 Tax=uncultured Succinatimonas sp. TaxID=1262973 RepID=UPI0025F0D608|nr:hypothetical protein [uncultured Succinatimonas sp.]